MLSNQEKLLEFQKSIERELDGQIAQIDADIEQYRQSNTQAIVNEVLLDCYRMIQKSIAKSELEFTTERSHALGELKRKLLLKRDEYASLVFGEVKDRLLAYAAGPEYADFIRRKLQGVAREYHPKKPSAAVREQDLHLKSVFEEALPACTLHVSKDIAIGGFIMKDEGKAYIINESLDSVLEEQKAWFFSNSGLRIPQI